ncbi:hypothetical protein CBR_g1198 [Chara braunii]|uniref:SMP-30/Gluconolactonase/LRE-like region domain-containing protein n=1 Tax=Chara braunii TaxID=69332 RepID=A0A388KDI3_CHABU|nr:hypothetical protein CBR_g1198 [Chara braunii]|eukprot:GBG68077.1 hypothetical protein CBR_g1198 [Chara braunii]
MTAVCSSLCLRLGAVLWLATAFTLHCVSAAPPSSTRDGSHDIAVESKSGSPRAQASRRTNAINFRERELEKLLAAGKELPESAAELYLRVLEPKRTAATNLQGRRRSKLMEPAQQSTANAINSRETALQRILRKVRKGVSATPSSTRGARRAMSSEVSRIGKRRAQGGGRHRNVRGLNESEVEDILKQAKDKHVPKSVLKLLLRVLERSGRDSVDMHERRSEYRFSAQRSTAALNFADKAIQETGTEGGEPHARVLEMIGAYNGPFQFVDSDVLTFRGNLLPSSSRSVYPEGDILVVQPYSVDESIYFLSEAGVWTLPTTSSSYGAASVSRAAGPFYDAQAFTIVDMSKYGRQGRFLLVAEADDDSLRTVSLDSYEPPFGIRYMTGFDSEILSLAADPSRPYVYFSTDYGIFKMYLPSSGLGSVVPVIDDASAIGSAQASIRGSVQSSIYGDAGFNEFRVSQHAFSADGQFMYAADQVGNAIYRVWIASGEVENIGSGYVDVDVDGPYGLALTSDGCNLFVSEWTTGRITLISFERSGGLVRSIRTLAGRTSGRYTESSIDLFGLAISPGGSYLYVGADEAIYKFEIDTLGLPSCSPISSTPRPVPPTIRPIISTSSPPPVIYDTFPTEDDEPTFPSTSTTTPTRNFTPPLPPNPPSPISFSLPPPTPRPPVPPTPTPSSYPQPSLSNSSSAANRTSSPRASKKQTDLTPVVISLAIALPVVGTVFGALLVCCLCALRRRRREAESRAIDRPVPPIATIDARARSQQIEPVAFTNNPTGAENWWQRSAGGGSLANDRLDVVVK